MHDDATMRLMFISRAKERNYTTKLVTMVVLEFVDCAITIRIRCIHV